MNGYKALELMADLLDHLRRTASFNHYSGQMRFMRHFGNRQALNIVAASGKQPDDTGKTRPGSLSTSV